ncbi:MAG: right-handed parallel beta-helix repeat-containing protein [Deltaproteobacteria bacterium]|nr:right-handed parallel beta-helix repeat-containing protein [Deltaproteobacteria bacterium]
MGDRTLLLQGARWVVAFGLWLVATAAAADECTLFVRAGHVSEGGPADGSSPARAFARIGDAAAAIINPGEVVCVGPGTYAEQNLAPKIDGTALMPIVFRGDASGASTGDAPGDVALTPPTPGAAGTAAFRLMGRRYVQIEGFRISDFTDAGIQARSVATGTGNSSEITLRNNVIERCGNGVDISGEGRFVLEGNTLIDNDGVGIGIRDCPASVDPLADPRCRGGVSKQVQPQISNNRTIYNLQHGVFISGASKATIQNTVAFGNFTGINVQGSSNVVIANNLLYGNASDAIAAGTGGQAANKLVVLHNTAYSNGGWGVRIGDNSVASENAQVFGNIFADNSSGGIAVARPSTCGYTAGFNLLDGPTPYGPSTPANQLYDLVRANPLFVDADGADGVLGWRIFDGQLVDYSADDDFHLQRMPGSNKTSPAVDAGYTTVAALGLQGSTSLDELADSGAADLGYHYEATPAQAIAATLPSASMPLYVRVGGADRNTGKSPSEAMATVSKAALLARAGVTVIVGPGQYADANIGPPQYGGKSAFIADPSGQATGDLPGPVLIDPSLLPTRDDKSTAFSPQQACDVVIDGFHVRNAADAGIQVRAGSHRAQVRNNQVFTNSRGIDVLDSNDVRVTNNLVYDNDTGGIQLGGSSGGANRALLQNNTCYANVLGNGVTLGVGAAPTNNARLEYNLLIANGLNGVNARSAYSGQSNLFFGNGTGTWGGAAKRLDGDLVDVNPQFVNPAGPDARLGGAHFQDDQFFLSQHMAGQATQSPAVDAGMVTAERAGMGSGTTSTNGTPDAGQVDLGFHYVATPPDTLYVDVNGDNGNDGRLASMPLRTIGEALRRAVEGTRVQLGAGTFSEGGLAPSRGVTIAGVDAQRTIIDAGGTKSTVFDVQAANVTLLRLGLTGATDVGVRSRGDGFRLIDTRVYANGGRGVVMPTGTGGLLFNNAIFANVSTGIVIGGTNSATDLVTVAHNTLYGNGGLGVTVGLNANVPSTRAALVNNVIAGNTSAGIGVGAASILTVQAGYNCNDDGYREIEKAATDIIGDPRLVDPEHGDFHLQQAAAGQPDTSRCVDAGWRSAAQMAIAEGSTRTDGGGDLAVADMGYHYALPIVDADAVSSLVRFLGPAGDCNADGATLINELVLAVNVALGAQSLNLCPVLDANGDGAVTISEIIAAVTDSLGS